MSKHPSATSRFRLNAATVVARLEERHLTRAEVADALRLSRAYWSRLVRRKRAPRGVVDHVAGLVEPARVHQGVHAHGLHLQGARGLRGASERAIQQLGASVPGISGR